MQDVPPVNVDISKNLPLSLYILFQSNYGAVLDPFIFNVFPRSLAWTAVYIVALAVLAWYLSDYIWQALDGVSRISRERDASFNDPAIATSSKKDL